MPAALVIGARNLGFAIIERLLADGWDVAGGAGPAETPHRGRRAEPPVSWITVAGPPCAFRNRAEALRVAYAPRAGEVAQRSKLSGSLSARFPPPNGPPPAVA